MESVKEKKRAIRQDVKIRKESVPMEERLQRSLAIQEKILSMPQVGQAGTILLYSSLPDEVGTSLLLARLSNRREGNKRVILPVVEGKYLLLKEYVPHEMAVGYRNISEPAGDDSVDPSEIDLAIIPGVAFDPSCNRLGRGKGFYDRLIPYLGCMKIGLGFDFQICARIPCEDFDKPLDIVVTESEIYQAPL